jgi:hypothetical protein
MRMLARDEQNVAKTLFVQVPRFRGHLLKVSVTRKIGLSREKPQYWQMLMHSLLTYNGAKNRITRPKYFSVSSCDCRASASR